jgi:hypothetical protein
MPTIVPNKPTKGAVEPTVAINPSPFLAVALLARIVCRTTRSYAARRTLALPVVVILHAA